MNDGDDIVSFVSFVLKYKVFLKLNSVSNVNVRCWFFALHYCYVSWQKIEKKNDDKNIKKEVRKRAAKEKKRFFESQNSMRIR